MGESCHSNSIVESTRTSTKQKNLAIMIMQSLKKISEQLQASMNCDIIENKGNTCYINVLLHEELARTLSMLKSRKAALDPSHVSQSL